MKGTIIGSQPPGEQMKLNVQVKPEDTAVCKCGAMRWYPTTKVLIVKTPVIGQEEVQIPAPQTNVFVCAQCGLAMTKENDNIMRLEDAIKEQEKVEKAQEVTPEPAVGLLPEVPIS